MEDEHIAVKLAPPQTVSRDTNVAMFGVWDGHGGQEGAYQSILDWPLARL